MPTTLQRSIVSICAALVVLVASRNVQAAGLPYKDAVLAKNPVAFWRLNESSGPTMVDISGNGHNGTYTAVTLGGTGVGPLSDNAGIFNGTSSKSTVPDNAAFDLLNFTVEAWVQLNGPTAGDIRVLNQQDGTNYWLLHLFRVAPGDYRLTSYFSLDGANNIQRGPNLNDGGYHHIALTRDTVNNLISFYVDGALAGPAVVTTNNTPYTIASDVALGAIATGGQFFPGLIDEAVIYDTALTADQIAANYQAALSYPVPEPSTLSLLGLGGLGLVWRKRRRARRAS